MSHPILVRHTKQVVQMTGQLSRRRVAITVLLLTVVTVPAGALDTVTRRSTDRRVAGEVTAVSRTEVTVTPKAGVATTVPANDIEQIEWDSAPAALGLARAKEASGQYALAIADYQKALTEVPAGRNHMRADVEYGIASSSGKLALVDDEQRESAISRLRAFIDGHPDHYRYYDALLLLGQTLLVSEDFAGAQAAYQQVNDAPWTDYQMAAGIALGKTALARGDVDTARTAFDRVAQAAPTTPAETARRFEALLGQAACLQQEQKYAEAANILDEIIRESAPQDTRLQAEAYLRQGDSFAALGGKTKQALMAYLHVDVIPSLAAHKDLHAEALYRLSQLWPQYGRPERSDQAAARLQSLYPHSPWTKKLSGG